MPSDQRRALRLLRITLMSVLTNRVCQLREIANAVKKICTSFDSGIAVFSCDGSVCSYGRSMEALLGVKLCQSVLSNTDPALVFLDESQAAIASVDLPWNKRPEQGEFLEPRFLMRSQSRKEMQWFACLMTKLAGENVTEPVSAACFSDVTALVNVERRLCRACQSFTSEEDAIETAVLQIEQMRDLLSRGKEVDKSELESFELWTRNRPPVAELEESEQSRKVLIVDDVAISQKLLAARLQKLNMESEYACNGQQGIEMALSGNYALIFMDCDMPVMDGFKATRFIRQAEISSGRHVPIIALTTYDSEEDYEHCLSAGMDEFLSKGSSADLLKEIVEWCLRRSQVKRDLYLTVDDYEENLDLSSLSKTLSNEELDQILELFLPSTNTLMRCLRMSMDERDIRSVGHFAYSLKGPFASLGMLMTCKLVVRLTDAAEENQWDEANDYYEMLRSNCDGIRSQIEARLARQN